jgi:hypothetical protein
MTRRGFDVDPKKLKSRVLEFRADEEGFDQPRRLKLLSGIFHQCVKANAEASTTLSE